MSNILQQINSTVRQVRMTCVFKPFHLMLNTEDYLQLAKITGMERINRISVDDVDLKISLLSGLNSFIKLNNDKCYDLRTLEEIS